MASFPCCTFVFLFLPSVFLRPTKGDFNSSRDVDRLLQSNAFKSFPVPAITGQLYPAVLPSNLSGVEANSIRFRSGSLRRRGATVKEFGFPTGIVVEPYVTRLIIVRQNLGNWSQKYYDYYPTGFRLATPVIGFLVYNASNLNASNLSELKVTDTGDAITIDFTKLTSSKDDPSALCVFFDLNGNVTIANQTAKSVCRSVHQGHFGLFVETLPPEKSKRSGKWRTWMGAIAGGVLVLILLVTLLILLWRMRKKKRIEELERRAIEDEAFGTTTVARVRTPVAAVTRTMPAIENDDVPGD